MRKPLFFFVLILLFFFSCSQEEKKTPELLQLSPAELRDSLIKINKEFVGKEDKVIDAYVDSVPYDFEKTGTGLRIAIIERGSGDSAQVGDWAIVSYRITDLQGKEIYKSKEGKSHGFLVGKDMVEQGLHEAIQKMQKGSRAIVVLPSHLAHGLSGDNAKIPPQTALVYELELLDIESN